MRTIILFVLLISVQLSEAQNITIAIDKDIPKGQQLPVGYDFENYLIQNLITYKIDTLKVKNGKVQIPNKTTAITPFAFAKNPPKKSFIFFAEPNKDVNISASEPSLTIKKVTGSQSQERYMKFMSAQTTLQKKVQKTQKELATTKFPDSLRKQITYNQMLMNTQFIEFINQERDNNLGAYMIYDIANNNKQISGKDLSVVYNKLSEKGKNTTLGKKVAERINRLQAMDVGSIAPDFTLANKDGKKYTLSSLRGKYVLLDFWASWCGPCVKEIPHLKKAYEEYHKKGFEIVSVSIDRKKSQWLKAVDKYKMPWISVIDNEKNEDKITQRLYHVPTIPRTILIDKNGKVVGKDFRGPALETKLAELL